ncbi:hypothetical protein L6452_10282 [Arctium lappa]|uniref:Uncharacterized protein n=1 Tax=Arctium lappa TaxID=4217 RepID=A0ACB9DM25_ARCLA|nr:hypothetical protein L6452_10282 [Arctium lappa]
MADKQPVSSEEPPFPTTEKLEDSILKNKYLWLTLIVCSIIFVLALVLCLCNKKKDPVHLGTFEGNITLAIKMAHNESYTSLKEFRNGRRGVQILVYEYVPNGSLLEHIVGREREPLTWRQRVNIAIQAAKGIAHLHEGIKPSIIHRDIKPSNILIGDGFEAKVSDFGLVRSGPVGDNSYVSSQVKGTPGYLDPAYCMSFHLSPFSDVYSFGIILLQLISARPAVDTNRSRSDYHIIEWVRPHLERGRVEEILDTNLLVEPCNMEVMLKMGLLGLRCVVKEPKQRPTMTQVFKELEAALRSVDGFVHRRLPTRSGRSLEVRERQVMEHDSSISLDGVGLQRFRVDMESLSFQSTSLQCLEADSFVFHVDDEGKAIEEMSLCMDDDLSIPRD